MDYFLLSYHSISVFTVLIITSIISFFLIWKQNKPTSLYWLLGMFLGYFFLYFGHFIAYSVFSPLAVYHRYLTLFVMFGISCFVAFSYYYPRNDYPREAKLVVPSAFALSTIGFLYFVIRSFSLEKHYNFTEHYYTFDLGFTTSLITLFLHLWCLNVLTRKTILHSEYNGFLAKWKKSESDAEKVVNQTQGHTPISSFFISVAKFWNPGGKDAVMIKNFAKAMGLLTIVATANFLNAAQVISHETYAYILSALSLFLSFYLIAVYFNHADISTSFLVKIVGASLVTLLLVIGYAGHIILTMSEGDYDTLRLSEIQNSKKNILDGNYEDISGNIKYILRKPLNATTDPLSSELLYSQDYLSHKQILRYETKEKQYKIDKISESLKSKYETLSQKELSTLANDELNRKGYQLNKRLYRNVGSFYTYYNFEHDNYLYEVGYSYLEYRQYTHNNLKKLFYAIIIMTIAILFVSPHFLKQSLVAPLDRLLLGVKKVNEGNLDVLVPISSQDEIGSLANSFNTMVLSLKDMREKMQTYTDSLEEKIRARTEEIQQQAEEVQKIKLQQQGDYFLTSLLAKPLVQNANRSDYIKTDFFIEQKKKFQFREKPVELGGDLCITDNLKFGHKNKHSKCVFVMNADAGEKSFQGAGGALVLGVVVNSILARSNANRKILEYTTPKRWLQDCFLEVNTVFASFKETLSVSAAFYLIEESGKMYYINAGHPKAILYRDKKADFLDKQEAKYGKLGSQLTKQRIQVESFQLQAKDCILVGSDGKDKVVSKVDKGRTEIYKDESNTIRMVEKSEGKLTELQKLLITDTIQADDISLLRIEFKKPISGKVSKETFYFGDNNTLGDEIYLEQDSLEEQIITTVVGHDSVEMKSVSDLYLEGRKNYLDGNIKKALEILSQAYGKTDGNQKVNKLFGLVCFKGKEYETAIRVLNHYLSQDPDNKEMWYYLSLAQRKLGKYLESIDSAKKFYKVQPENVQNLINLSDLYRLNGNLQEAKKYTEKAVKLDPENTNVKKLLKALEHVA
ncbi:MAG: SpoIIE family protein phosphatase [Spirochaetota bacterium]